MKIKISKLVLNHTVSFKIEMLKLTIFLSTKAHAAYMLLFVVVVLLFYHCFSLLSTNLLI